MSQPFNFAAERESDLFVKPTPDAADRSWDHVAERNVNVPQRVLADIPERTTIPPRIVRLYLESEQATSKDSRSMTWMLNFSIAAFRPGTVIVWRDLSLLATTSIPSIVVGLGGIRTLSFSTNTATGFAFKTCAQLLTGGNGSVVSACLLAGDGTPLAATLMDLDFMRTGSITLSLLEASNVTWDNTTKIRVGLEIIEPGARMFG